MPPIAICFVASEVAPLSKSGGLGDVAGALPRMLHARGHDIRVFTPLYSNIDRAAINLTSVDEVRDVPVLLGGTEFRFNLHTAHPPSEQGRDKLPIYLIDCPALYHRGTLYTTDADEPLRFLLLQRAVFESCQRLRFAPQVLHCNDWHTALMPLMLKTTYAWDQLFARTRSLLSIHNIGYRGDFPASTIAASGFTYELGKLDPNDVAHGQIVWLREGIRHADGVATVSPTYAREICTPGGGAGLDATLRARATPPVGILNGVDYSQWSPENDPYLPAHFSAADMAGKTLVKQALLTRMRLPPQVGVPLIGIVSRFALQKGFDLLFDTLPELLAQRDFACVVLGSGEQQYEDFFRSLALKFPRRVAFQQGYSEELAHWIEAGSDMFLMPSLYEPCGLNQMYSLKYGTVPIVRRTGGLADSVEHWNPATGRGTGIVFNDFDAPAIRWALHTALDHFKDRANWQRLMRNGMAMDFSWSRQVSQYEDLYESLTWEPEKKPPLSADSDRPRRAPRI